MKPSPMYEPFMMSSLNRALARVSTIYQRYIAWRSEVTARGGELRFGEQPIDWYYAQNGGCLLDGME